MAKSSHKNVHWKFIVIVVPIVAWVVILANFHKPSQRVVNAVTFWCVTLLFKDVFGELMDRLCISNNMAKDMPHRDLGINVKGMKKGTKKDLRKVDRQKKLEVSIDKRTKIEVIINYQQDVSKVIYWKKLLQVGPALYLVLLFLVLLTAFYKPLEGLNKALGHTRYFGVMVLPLVLYHG